jgi:hypothetical protein
MKNFFRKMWGAEPIIAAAASGVGVWEAIPPVLAAFGYPLTPMQIKALGGLIGALSVALARSKVFAADTHAEAVQNALRQSV